MPVQFYLLFFAAVLSHASEATPENLSIAFDSVSNPSPAVKRPGQRQATHPKLLQVHTLRISRTPPPGKSVFLGWALGSLLISQVGADGGEVRWRSSNSKET